MEKAVFTRHCKMAERELRIVELILNIIYKEILNISFISID